MNYQSLYFNARHLMVQAIRTVICLGVLLLVMSCSHRAIEQMPSHNQNTRVHVLVMHFTAINYARSVRALVDDGGLSSHYLLPEKHDPTYPYDHLKVLQLVDEQARAWHAGHSFWQGRTGLNDQSIGIEIVNVPECKRDNALGPSRAENAGNRVCLFPDYDPEQIQLLIELSQSILSRHPDIHPTAVVGHSDIAPSRKNDPGPRFPWYQLYKAGVGAWYENETLTFYWSLFNERLPSIGLTQAALREYGYGLIETGVYDQKTTDTLSAFQMHFTPTQVSGDNDSHTNAALFALLDKYFPDKLKQLLDRYEEEASAVLVVTQPPAKRGQIDTVFPLAQRSDRQWVNDRARFKSYAGRGSITLEGAAPDSGSAGSQNEPVHADIFVNGEKLQLNDGFLPNQPQTYSLARRTRDGENLLKVENVRPDGAKLNITIPYPTLEQSSTNSGYDFTAVDSFIQADIKAGFPGAVLLVAKQGKIIKHTAYGYAERYAPDGSELEHPVPMTLDTVFDLASNTKTFATTLAVMHLVSQGKLSLDTPVYHYLPEFRGDGREARSVRDLLDHRSGYAPSIGFYDKDNPLGSRFFSQQANTTKDLLVQAAPFTQSRGLATQYSDTNFMLLGVLVERVSGLALDHYVEHHLYRPLGLHHTVFNPLTKLAGATRYAATELNGNSRDGRVDFARMRTHTLRGEVHDEKAFYSMGGVSGHAGLFSTASDLAVLAQMLLNGGGYGEQALFPSAVVNQFSQPSQNDYSMGLGFRLAADGTRRWQFGPYASTRAFGHTGWTGTLTVIDPTHDLAIILLTNMRHTPINTVTESNGNAVTDFVGRRFETGRYGSVASLVYEAVLAPQP
ncbi:penicillin binding protein PBP4B [Alteromonas sp. SM 2104]|nr:penicillin binding protein PBP4B [Alteromonas oceanisediminis]